MANSDDVNRAQEGRDCWNKWADAEISTGKTTPVDFSGGPIAITNFRGFVFPGPANFANVHFTRPVTFKKAEFRQKAIFSRAEFYKCARFSGATFKGQAVFSHAVFQADVALDRMTVDDDAKFDGAKFRQSVYAAHTRFRDYVTFRGAEAYAKLVLVGANFEGEADFRRATFAHSDFTGTQFKTTLTWFSGVNFLTAPDFRASTFATPPNFQDADVAATIQTSRVAGEDDDAAKFRRLKQLASEAKDHERELEFFAKELQAKRVHETNGIWRTALSLAYEVLSDFGRSVARPLLCLLALIMLPAAVMMLWYSPVSSVALIGFLTALVLASLDQGTASRVRLLAALTIGAVTLPLLASLPAASITLATITLSFTNTALLLGADKWTIRCDALQLLFGECKLSLIASLAAYVQSGLSLLLMFLIGLGLRNRFRTGTS
jgi:uncharacterized protein YjbI with pentapeptide repeats